MQNWCDPCICNFADDITPYAFSESLENVLESFEHNRTSVNLVQKQPHAKQINVM